MQLDPIDATSNPYLLSPPAGSGGGGVDFHQLNVLAEDAIRARLRALAAPAEGVAVEAQLDMVKRVAGAGPLAGPGEEPRPNVVPQEGGVVAAAPD